MKSNDQLKRLVVEEYKYMDAKSRLQQLEKAIEHGTHSMNLTFEKNSREGVLAVSEAGFDSGAVIVRLEGKDGLTVQDDGTPLTDAVRESLSKNEMLNEGRVTPRRGMSTALLEYDIDLYKNRFKLGVPSTFVERAEKALPDEAFKEFLEHVNEGTYSTASSAFAKAVKDNDVEVTDDIRSLYKNLKRVRLKGDDELIPDFAKESVRERLMWETALGIVDPEKLVAVEKKLKHILDTARLLLKVADRAGVSPEQMQLYIQEALDEIQQQSRSYHDRGKIKEVSN